MCNKNNEDFENILQDPTIGLDIEADEMAMENSGLIHPNDLELERILAEDWDSVPDQEIPEMTPEEALNQFLYGDEDISYAEESDTLLSVSPEEAPVEEAAPVEETVEEEAPVEDAAPVEIIIEDNEPVADEADFEG